MGAVSKIEWTDASWTPIRARNKATGKVGWHCEHESEGCRNCYAEGMNKRLGTGLEFKPGHRDSIEIFLDEKILLAPLHWKRPRKIFVCSMTDLFADFVPDEMIDKMFAVMALCPQHIFQVLTKRPERMRQYIFDASDRIVLAMMLHTDAGYPCVRETCEAYEISWTQPRSADDWWPLRNVWLGTSCEDQATADARIPDLLATPAAFRFISAEPLLGPIVLSRFHIGWERCRSCGAARDPSEDHPLGSGGQCSLCDGDLQIDGHYLHQVITGGESGPHARPMHPDWARSLRDLCAAAGIPFFFKQWGEWADAEDWPSEMQEHLELLGKADGNNVRVGKSRAGRLLDGIEHNAMPEARA